MPLYNVNYSDIQVKAHNQPIIFKNQLGEKERHGYSKSKKKTGC